MFKSYRQVYSALVVNVALVAFAQLASPTRAQANAGDLFASDPVANSIIVYGLDGTMRTFATGLNNPQGLAFDRLGNLFVADKGSGRIYKFTADGTRSIFATGLSAPTGLTFDGLVLDVAEQTANRITRIDPQGNRTTFLSLTAPSDVLVAQAPQASPLPSPSPTPDPTVPRTFVLNPTALTTLSPNNTKVTHPLTGGFGVAVDGVLNAFVSRNTGDIIQFAPNGTQTTFATGLTTPTGIAFRPKRFSNSEEGVGNLFVAETSAGDIAEYTPAGVRTVFATGGHPQYLTFELLLSGKLLNIATRVLTETGDNVLIGGLIITGDTAKTVLLRGIGPSLADAKVPVPGALQDPVLELHGGNGKVLRRNDNWKASQEAEIEATGIAPTDDRESAILISLNPGAYTVILSGKGATTGVGLVEAYDLDDLSGGTPGELANISTRGFVGTGDDVMIGGFIIEPTKSARILVRALGPSLKNAAVPVSNPLANPFLELRDGDGDLVSSNDDWQDTAEAEIESTGVAPPNPRESAILANLRGGNYTALVRGVEGGSGVGLVEIYHLP